MHEINASVECETVITVSDKSTNEFVYHLANGLVSSGDDCVLEGEGRDKRNCVYFLYIIITLTFCICDNVCALYN